MKLHIYNLIVDKINFSILPLKPKKRDFFNNKTQTSKLFYIEQIEHSFST